MSNKSNITPDNLIKQMDHNPRISKGDWAYDFAFGNFGYADYVKDGWYAFDVVLRNESGELLGVFESRKLIIGTKEELLRQLYGHDITKSDFGVNKEWWDGN